MKYRVTKNQVTESRRGRFVTEASVIGLPPTKWPTAIRTDIGNRQPFYVHAAKLRDGQVTGIFYRQALGCISLFVIND